MEASSSRKRAREGSEDPRGARSGEDARAERDARGEVATLEAELEAKDEEELLGRLPAELWQKIIDDENVQQNDVVALASTCRFFREKQKVLGRNLETDLSEDHFLKLLKTGKMASHSFGWFRWVSDTFEIRPGFTEWRKTAKGAMYEGDLLNYAALQGSVEILRWLHEEKGWELSDGDGDTGWCAGRSGSVQVLEYLKVKGYKFDDGPCQGAARGGHLNVLKWCRSQTPPCPWNAETCCEAVGGGHLEILKWARDQDPPCPWSRRQCRGLASQIGPQDIAKWIDQQEDESDAEDYYY